MMNGEIVKRLQQKRTSYSSSQWEKEYENLQDRIRSYKELREALCSRDVNETIFTLINVIPNVTDLLTDEERGDLEILVREHLTDTRMCEVPYGGSYADDDDARTVSDSAEYALGVLSSERY